MGEDFGFEPSWEGRKTFRVDRTQSSPMLPAGFIQGCVLYTTADADCDEMVENLVAKYCSDGHCTAFEVANKCTPGGGAFSEYIEAVDFANFTTPSSDADYWEFESSE